MVSLLFLFSPSIIQDNLHFALENSLAFLYNMLTSNDGGLEMSNMNVFWYVTDISITEWLQVPIIEIQYSGIGTITWCSVHTPLIF